MYTKYFFAIFLCILSLSFVFSLDQDQIPTKLNETYLFSPLDSGETVLSATQIIYLNQKYWAIETNNHNFLIINDKNAALFVNQDVLTNVLKTHLLFSKINNQNNTKIAYFFNGIPDTITQFNFTLELVKKELSQEEFPDENVLVGIQNVETRAINLGNNTIKLREYLMTVDANLNAKNYNNYIDIKELSKIIATTTNNISQNLNLLQRSITDLKIILVDANINTELKYQIGNNVLVLPQPILQIPDYIAQTNTNIENISNAIAYADEANLDTIEKNWELRLERIIFLKKYLANDKDISTATKQKNIKELFDTIIAGTNEWKNNKETITFVNAYNKMNTDITKGEYESAERQLKPLKDSALKIFKDGKNTSTGTTGTGTTTGTDTTTDETQSNPIFTIALICLGAIVLIIIVMNIIKKVKEMKDKQNKENKDEDQKDIEVNFN